MTIVKLAALAVLITIFALKLKTVQVEYSTYISLGLCIFILFFVTDRLSYIVEQIESLSAAISINSIYIKILLKLIGVAYICEFASNLCKDAGFGAISGQIEMAGKVTMMVMSMPIIFAIIETITGFLA